MDPKTSMPNFAQGHLLPHYNISKMNAIFFYFSFEVLQCDLKKRLTWWFSLFCKMFHILQRRSVTQEIHDVPGCHMNTLLMFILGSVSQNNDNLRNFQKFLSSTLASLNFL